MNCDLEKLVNHNNMRDKFKNSFIYCPLMKKDDTGMFRLGVVCGGCCVRLQMLVEEKEALVLRNMITKEDLKRNPNILDSYLSENLKEYWEEISGMGLTIDVIEDECKRCKAEPIEDKPEPSEPTEVTQCGREELK